MMETWVAGQIPAGPAAGIANGRPIDLVHLARMTLGDRSLEREVLQLFVRQAATLLERMEQAAPTAVATLAHTLNGSARGLGAWRVAAAAEAVEVLAATKPDALAPAMTTLSSSVEEASTIIAELLRAH